MQPSGPRQRSWGTCDQRNGCALAVTDTARGTGRSVAGDLERFERALRSLARRLEAAPARSAHCGIVPSTAKGLEPAAYALLIELDREGPRRVSTLAAALGRDVSTVSREVSGLERHGLIARERDPDDRRAVRLALTGRGCGELSSARAVRRARLERAFSVLEAARAREVVHALEQMAVALDECGGAADDPGATPVSGPARTGAGTSRDRVRRAAGRKESER